MKKSNWLGVKKISSFSTHTFTNKKLLDIALTHRSVGSDNNERLEYLGDAILGFIIAEYLYINFTEAAEGDLTRLRAMLVKKETLALIARENSLDKKIRLGTGELKSGGWRRDSILANTLEAIIGAIYLDSNIEECRVIINKLYDIKNNIPQNLDYNESSFNKYISCLTLKELLIYNNDDIYDKYTGYLNQVNLIKQNTIALVTKEFLSNELYGQRNTIIQLLLKSDEHEYQYLVYLLCF